MEKLKWVAEVKQYNDTRDKMIQEWIKLGEQIKMNLFRGEKENTVLQAKRNELENKLTLMDRNK